ncbi:RNA polymerase sigma factor [Chloroflexota bacterium]
MIKSIGNKVRKGKTAQAAATTVTRDNQAEIVGLVKKAAGGNFNAFGELYSLYLDPIYRYVFYQVKDKMTAEDITEEVFVKAWKAIESCQGKEQTFSSWLYRIAHNHMINTLRKTQKCTSIEQHNIVDIKDAKQEVEIGLEYRELLEAITCLPQNQKQVIILKFIEGMETREIGKIMGKREGAIRILQMRALNTLKRKTGRDNK